MEYVIYFDVAAILILLVFLISTIARRQYRGRANGILFRLILSILIASLGDLLEGYCGNLQPSENARLLMYIGNYVYLIGHTLIVPLFVHYVYAAVDIWHIYKSKKILVIYWRLALAVAFAIIALNGWALNVFEITADLRYVRGLWMYVIFAIEIVFAIWGFLQIIYYNKVISGDKVIVIGLIYVLVVAGVITELVTGYILIELFSMTIGLTFYLVMVKRTENQIDPITGAIKYNAGIEKVSKNFATNKPVVVVLVKVINYKNINIYLGQQLYNEFIRKQTESLSDIVNSEKIVADIFYLEHCLYACVIEGNNLDKAVETAETIKKTFSEKHMIEGFEVFPEPVLFVARFPEDLKDFPSLYSIGITFHHLMPEGKDILVYSEYKNDKIFRIRNNIKSIIGEALEKHQIELLYQPVYSLREGKCVSAEAIPVINSPEYGYIHQDIFLPYAEQDGSIHDIGDCILEAVIRFLAVIDKDRYGLEYIATPLSPVNCLESDLVEKTTVLLEDYVVAPDNLCFEITESAADVNPAVVDSNVRKLHTSGVRFAIKDYGMGYSNMKRLISLPFEQVMLNEIFVENLEDSKMMTVLKDTVKMMKEMGKTVSIEGVRSVDVLDKIKELDIDYVQGVNIKRELEYMQAMPEDEFIRFMEENA
jgi:EAL domain-containing protein (putative c-di-GMP-specific phosphodiesterase class I)